MATTINAYKVSLSLDAGQYISASTLSRSETNRLRREIERARTPADNYSRSLQLVQKALTTGAINQRTYNALLDAAKSKFTGAATAAKGYGSSIATAAVGLAGGLSGTSLVKDSVKIAAEAESASIAFEVLTGSVQDSAAMIEGLRQLAASSPLTLEHTQSAARTMLSFGIESEKILPSLKMMGDITGGNAERFKNLTLGFSQMAAAGRLMGGELRQMVESGFNPLQEISRQTGESLIELKERMEAGGIATKEVAAAFKSATSEGGMFYGMIDRMSKTTEGKFAKLTDDLYGFRKALGETIVESEQFGGGFAWVADKVQKMRMGMEVVAGGGAANIAGDTQTALDKIKQQQFVADRQMRLRREGKPTFLSEENKMRAQQSLDPMGGSVSGNIEGLIGSSIDAIDSMSSTVLNGLSTFQQAAESIAMSGMAQTQELVRSLKDDPAITNLQEGTQEAYEYLTRATREADQRGRLEAVRQQQLNENAAKQRVKMNQYLDAINKALVANGFKRIR